MSGSEPTTWEYRRVPATDDARVAELGKSGWELIGIEGGTLFFKRPRLSFREQVTLDQKRRYYGEWGLPVAEDAEEGR